MSETGGEAMHVPVVNKLKWDWTVNPPFMLTLVVALVGFAWWATTTTATITSTLVRQQERSDAHFAAVDRAIIDMNGKIAVIESAARERTAQWAPQVVALSKSQDVQDERIGNLIESTKALRDANAETRRAVSDIAGSVSTLREDFAGVRAALGIGRDGSALKRAN